MKTRFVSFRFIFSGFPREWASRLGVALLLLLWPAAGFSADVRLGIDALRDQNFAALAGKRIGLITNQTGVDASGRKTRLILKDAPGVHLATLFTPEHGLDGTEGAGKYVATRRDPLTGLTAYSLYGPTRKPTPEMLRGLDALVFDLQDVGCRSYTYLSTMARCMEAAGENHIEFIVLDRPDPLGGLRVEGPGIESQWISFVGQFPVPYVHGMTAGELAKMINANHWMAAQCKLTVIPMSGWRRDMTWDETGLQWIRSSPNIPRGNSSLYYVATGIVGDLSGLDIGIGTDAPFQRVAARSLSGEALAERMRSAGFPGVRFTPCQCKRGSGVCMEIDPHAPANLTALNVYFASELYRGAGSRLFKEAASDPDQLLFKVYGSRLFQTQIEGGASPERIVASWSAGVERFKQERAAYLLY